jgi:dTDP-glucose 4,6-dehydratase
MRKPKNLLVTGGAGFIGTNFIRYLFGPAGYEGRIVNLDALTYAGNPANLEEYERGPLSRRYAFAKGDICDRAFVEQVFAEREIDAVVHFAAESHVDRSLLGPEAFMRSNVMGTFTLLDVARSAWKGREDVLFHHISTDEVFGSLGDEGKFTETTPYDPRSPYSASKAGSDHLARAYYHSYGLPVTLSNCSNNYGPYQFPEKLIPLMILNMLEGKSLPVYGDGKNVRDWLYVEDHASAIWAIVQRGKAGCSYNVGGENEWENIRLLDKLIEIVAAKTGKSSDSIRSTIRYVKDRPGHDRRYAIDCSAIKRELGWKQSLGFDEGLEKTVDWYLANEGWIDSIKSGAYRGWIESNYSARK